MSNVYSAADYRTQLRNAFETWTDKHVIVRDSCGATLADGVLAGIKPTSELALGTDGKHSNFPGEAFYGFTSGGPLDGEPLSWNPNHTIEII